MNKETIQKLVASTNKDDVYLGIMLLGKAILSGKYESELENNMNLHEFGLSKAMTNEVGGVYFGGFSIWLGYESLKYSNGANNETIKGYIGTDKRFITYE